MSRPGLKNQIKSVGRQARAFVDLLLKGRDPYCPVCVTCHSDWTWIEAKPWFCKRCYEREDEPTSPGNYPGASP